MATNSVLARLAVQISANTSEFNKSLKDTQNTLKNFVGNFQSAAAAIGVGFGAQQIGQFAIETAKLAGQADAVRVAFERLPEATKLMSQLKQATSNTVSEFDLMKAAVKASNFQIELSQLPKLLQFATLRAQQTGQSVDYLVESIIMGIGRKSPMILDNLGISLVRLREKLKGVGTESASVAQMTEVVGQIANEDLQNMSGFATNAATKIEQIAAAYTDLKVSIGNNLQQSNHYNSLLENVKNQLIVWNSSEVSFWTKLFSSAKEYQQIVADIESKQRAAAGEIGPTARTYDQFYNNLIQNAKTFGATMAAQLAPTEEQLDKQKKALDEAAKKWDEYYRRITGGAEVAYRNVASLVQEMMAVGLGAAKEGPGMEKLLKLPGIEITGGFEKEGDPFGIQKFVESLQPAIDGMNAIQQKALSMKDSVVAANEQMKDSFVRFAAEGISVAAESLGMLLVEEMSYKQFGREILRMLAGFMKDFGKQLILIGTGMLLAGDKVGGLRRIAVGTALSIGSGADAVACG